MIVGLYCGRRRRRFLGVAMAACGACVGACALAICGQFLEVAARWIYCVILCNLLVAGIVGFN